MTFVRRKIDVTITLGTGKFGDVEGDTITLSGHRVIAEIVTIPSGMQPQANLKIYGLPMSKINQLTTIGPTMTAIRGKNKLSVSAGNEGQALSLIFEGTIDQAWGDFQAAPDVCLNITALAALSAAMKPVSPSSFKGSTAAEMVIAGLAKDMGFSFENHGAAARLSSPYFPGTAYEQMTSCAQAAGINYIVDKGVLAIWPKDGFIKGDVPVITPENGMVGYPIFSSSGIAVTTIFRADVRAGAQFFVDSSIEPARGYWRVFAVQHSLESENPGGPWFTYISGNKGV